MAAAPGRPATAQKAVPGKFSSAANKAGGGGASSADLKASQD